MEKIQMTTPLVEMDGDEMTRILWQYIKDELIYPFIDLKSEYYDLGLVHRNETDESVQPSHLMRQELRSTTSRRCGRALTELSEQFLMVQCSEHLSL